MCFSVIKRRGEGRRSKHDYLVMRVIKRGKNIVVCNTCKKYLIVDKGVEEWYREHNKKHIKGVVGYNICYIPNHKGDKKGVYCLICKESCYPSLNGKIPESKEEFETEGFNTDVPQEQRLDLWYNKHSSLFHKNEEPIPLGRSPRTRVLGLSPNVERLYKCDICNALYREKSNIEKHLKYLHGINDKKVEPIEINFKDNKERSGDNKFGIVIDKKSKKSIVSLVKEGDYIICMHCNKQYNNMLELAEHIKAFSNTNAEDWIIEGGRDLLSFF
ncbi:MAG: hypothetical protein KatS3mg003_0731 [Candidatus Nitrosocaldaceae archaeon]|nr:MAG: hypothetical protein KatS3mg003_0731 [Candidatus Nitrosocaldaceae archaeon]